MLIGSLTHAHIHRETLAQLRTSFRPGQLLFGLDVLLKKAGDGVFASAPPQDFLLALNEARAVLVPEQESTVDDNDPFTRRSPDVRR
ncbi:MAG: hypothetical protein GY822_22385 [Deltaproteobacteria bacterium]|nr:hypothetical protein [Deltaproteobacteria bacterium]